MPNTKVHLGVPQNLSFLYLTHNSIYSSLYWADELSPQIHRSIFLIHFKTFLAIYIMYQQDGSFLQFGPPKIECISFCSVPITCYLHHFSVTTYIMMHTLESICGFVCESKARYGVEFWVSHNAWNVIDKAQCTFLFETNRAGDLCHRYKWNLAEKIKCKIVKLILEGARWRFVVTV